MKLGLFGKMKIIFEMLFSSFMSIEIFLFFFLLLLLLVCNIKVKNKFVSIVICSLLILGVIMFGFYFSSYTLMCVDSFIMKIMNYYYFPSSIVYFFLFLFMLFMCIFTMFAKNIKWGKKVFNYICSIMVFLLFSMFVVLVVYENIDMTDAVVLYQNNQILSIVQISNLILLFWVVVSFFYHLYLFFQKRFDKKG